jgi:hypothetical protein
VRAAVCGHALSWRSTTVDVSIPCLLFWMDLRRFLVFRNTLLTLLRSLIAWIPSSALLSCPRKQLLSAFWQAVNVCLKFFGLLGECVCIHWFDWSLVSTFKNKTQISSYYSYFLIFYFKTGNVQLIEVHPCILYYLVVLLLENFKICGISPIHRAIYGEVIQTWAPLKIILFWKRLGLCYGKRTWQWNASNYNVIV